MSAARAACTGAGASNGTREGPGRRASTRPARSGCEADPPLRWPAPQPPAGRAAAAGRGRRPAGPPRDCCPAAAAAAGTGAPAPASASPAALDALVAWVAKNGGSTGPTKPAVVPEGLGLIATRDLTAGDALFSIPRAACLSAAAVQKSSLGPHVAGLKPWVALALLLLRERADPASLWAPYLRLLPEQPDGTLFWSEAELSLLEGSQLLSSTLSYRDYVAAECAAAQAALAAAPPGLLGPPGTLTPDSFAWAFGVLRSRALPPLEGPELALVPYADLTNHSRGVKVGWEAKKNLFGGESAVTLKADRSYRAGEQVYLNYGAGKGSRTDSQLALDFGFADPPDAAAGGFYLQLTLPSDDRFYDDKLDIAETAGLGASHQFLLRANEPPPAELRTYLRLMNLSGPDAFLLEALFRQQAWDLISQPVSEANEGAICSSMAAGCREALAGYSCSAAEDLSVLAGGRALTPRAQAAVRVRLGEKLALQSTLDYFEQLQAALPRIEFYQERRLKSLRLLDDTGKSTYDDEIESMFKRFPGGGM